MAPRALNLPSLATICQINRSVRQPEEWFDEPDDLERLRQVLASIDVEPDDDPLAVAAALIGRIARAQAFGEGNKRTALLTGALFLDRCGIDGSLLDSDGIGRLLVAASIGTDVETAVLTELRAAAGRHGV